MHFFLPTGLIWDRYTNSSVSITRFLVDNVGLPFRKGTMCLAMRQFLVLALMTAPKSVDLFRTVLPGPSILGKFEKYLFKSRGAKSFFEGRINAG